MKPSANSTQPAKLALILGLVIAIGLLGVGMYALMNKPVTPNTTPQTYTVSVSDYHYFNFEDLEYGFILARVTISSNKLFSIDLSHMNTNEQVELNAVDSYKTPLVNDGYRLTCPGIDEIGGLNTSLCLFIPVLNTSASELVLKVFFDRAYNLSFNLLDETHRGTKAMVGINETFSSFTALITRYRVVSTRSFTVEDAEGGTVEAPFNSQSQVFGFEVRIENRSTMTTLETAILTITGVGTYQLVNPEYKTDEEVNLLGLSTSTQQTGFLFFEITDPTLDLSELDPRHLTLSLRAAGETDFVTVSAAP
jgi:hypothetical protein